MKKSFQKTLISLTLIMALLVSGIAYQTDTAKAEDNYNVILNTPAALASAGIPVEYTFTLVANKEMYIGCEVAALVNAHVKITQVSTNEVWYEADYPNTERTEANPNGGWIYDEQTGTYFREVGSYYPAAGEYKISVTFDADTAYVLYGAQSKTYSPYLASTNITVTKGFTQKLTVNNSTGTVTWKSSNTKVATVDKNGKVTGKKAGKATITATYANGYSDKCTVTVKENAYTAPKGTVKDVRYGSVVMSIYKVSYSKGNIVIKARLLNNTSSKVSSLSNLKITIKNEKGKVIGTYTASKVAANVKGGKKKDYTFTIKKSKLKIKSTQDLRKIKKPSATGRY